MTISILIVITSVLLFVVYSHFILLLHFTHVFRLSLLPSRVSLFLSLSLSLSPFFLSFRFSTFFIVYNCICVTVCGFVLFLIVPLILYFAWRYSSSFRVLSGRHLFLVSPTSNYYYPSTLSQFSFLLLLWGHVLSSLSPPRPPLSCSFVLPSLVALPWDLNCPVCFSRLASLTSLPRWLLAWSLVRQNCYHLSTCLARSPTPPLSALETHTHTRPVTTTCCQPPLR